MLHECMHISNYFHLLNFPGSQWCREFYHPYAVVTLYMKTMEILKMIKRKKTAQRKSLQQSPKKFPPSKITEVVSLSPGRRVVPAGLKGKSDRFTAIVGWHYWLISAGWEIHIYLVIPGNLNNKHSYTLNYIMIIIFCCLTFLDSKKPVQKGNYANQRGPQHTYYYMVVIIASNTMHLRVIKYTGEYQKLPGEESHPVSARFGEKSRNPAKKQEELWWNSINKKLNGLDQSKYEKYSSIP